MHLVDTGLRANECASMYAVSREVGSRRRGLSLSEFRELLARLVPVQAYKIKKQKQPTHQESIHSWHSSRPVTPRQIRGIDLFRSMVSSVLERNPKEINRTRMDAFVGRLEFLLKLMGELKGVKIRR